MKTKVTMTMKSLLVASALALTFGPAIAANGAAGNADAAQPANLAKGATFSQLDTNKDGVIDQNEAAASSGVARTFNQADSNKDGKLSRDEFNAAYSKGQ